MPVQRVLGKESQWASLLAIFSLIHMSQSLIVNRDINLPQCYSELVVVNGGPTGRVDEDDFFNLLKRLDDDDVLANKPDYESLAYYGKETYEILISVCLDDPWSFACAVNNTNGFPMPPPPRPGVTEAPELYLFNICYSTYDTLDHFASSQAPTDAPSDSPSQSPSAAPSSSPSQYPSDVPSASPSNVPSQVPSASPSNHPSAAPSPSPSAVPTVSLKPSINSGAPTTVPTISLQPSAGPTRVVTESVTFRFNFALVFADNDNDKGLDPTEYYGLIQLIFGTMVADLNTGRRLRSLGVTAGTYYTFSNPTFFDCPPQNTQLLEDPLCVSLDLTGSLTLAGPEAVDESTIETAIDVFKDDIETQVDGGRFQFAVDRLDYENPDTGLEAEDYILVLHGLNGNADRAQAGDTNGSSGGGANTTTTSAVVGVAMLVLLVPFVLLLFQRSRSRDDDKQKVFYEPYEYDPDEDSPSEMEPQEADLLQLEALSSGITSSRGSHTLGATRANYGLAKPSRRVLEAMEAGDDIVAEPEFDIERDSSSNAGSSGWSSSAGISSYNTGSMDDSMDAAYAAGTTLAAIGGVTSSLNKHMHNGSQMSMSDSISSATGGNSHSPHSAGYNRDQLDSFIEAGDWAAVGATAALLAAASDSQSASTSPSKISRSTFGEQSLEAQRAAELDHLVDAGDWEGVVLAAARFEAAETTVYSRGSRTASSADSTGSASGASGTLESGTVDSPSDSGTYSMSRSDDPSRTRQRNEIRAEVEALVRRVVPEEIDNVDEMMNQFKGREEELVETLRTMQERAIAQKARTAGQKSAKMEARRNVQRGVVPGAKPPPAETRPVAMRSSEPSQLPVMRNVPVVPLRKSSLASSSQSGTNSASVSSQSGSNAPSGEGSTIGSMKDTRTVLEAAINAGDWEAVGKAAAFLSDNSVASNGTGPGAYRGQSNNSITSGSTRSRATKDSEMAIRQQELDEMISKGDWSAVVAAANRFSQKDKNVRSDVGRTAEEEDALQQAKMWANIANQTRTEGANDAGASHAAEWAIQRSLLKMNQEKRTSPGRDRGYDEV